MVSLINASILGIDPAMAMTNVSVSKSTTTNHTKSLQKGSLPKQELDGYFKIPE